MENVDVVVVGDEEEGRRFVEESGSGSGKRIEGRRVEDVTEEEDGKAAAGKP
jgi:hypothetical protein